MGLRKVPQSVWAEVRGEPNEPTNDFHMLSLEKLSLNKDNFPIMTKVSDPVNFHLSEKCGGN